MRLTWKTVCVLCCGVLSGCSGEKYGNRHSVPTYKRYFIQDGRDLTTQECEQLRQLVEGSRMDSEGLYGPADVMIYGSNDGQHVAEIYSIYLDDRVIYFGDWLDARTQAMAEKEVECLKFSRSDKHWLSSLQPKRGK